MTSKEQEAKKKVLSILSTALCNMGEIELSLGTVYRELGDVYEALEKLYEATNKI